MSLLDGVRSSQADIYTRNWTRGIVKELSQKAKAEAAEEAELEEAAFLAATRRSSVDGRPSYVRTPPKTPQRAFVRVKDAIRGRGPAKAVGAFGAHVTAAPGTGFLPKPNQFVPGLERSLGPAPKRLSKGEYPNGYAFARKIGRCGTMMWANNESLTPAAMRAERRNMAATLASETAAASVGAGGGGRVGDGGGGASSSRAPTERNGEDELGLPTLAASASAPELSRTAASGTGDRDALKTSSYGKRPPSGVKKLMGEARFEGTVQRLQNPETPYGASSWFLATKQYNTDAWAKDWKQIKQGDSGQSFYWGC